MQITIHVPSSLRATCGGLSEFSISAKDTAAALQVLERERPELYTSICNETGALRPHINLFVNDNLLCNEDDYLKSFQQSDVLYIFPAVSGG